MSYIGNTPTTQSFISGTDYFNGTGAQTAFTLSRTVASVNDIQAVVNNVVQVPNDAYTISGTTITFTSAPSSGTQNVYVRYLSTTTQAITPSQNTVSWNTLDSNVQGDLGISFKNRIINGNMVIDQRNAGASVALGNSNTYVTDRFNIRIGTGSGATGIQSSTAPVGFTKSLLVTIGTGASPAAGDLNWITQPIEGLNVADLGWGTANAKTITVSFWVRSSVTGTYTISLTNAGLTRSYVATYTVDSANTFEYKTITVTGDTSGTWATDNTVGVYLFFDLGSGSTRQGAAGSWSGSWLMGTSGSVKLIQTSGATLYLTGVMLEVGTQATTFTTAGGSYGAELALCQRYYFQITPNGTQYSAYSIGYASTTTDIALLVRYPVPPRTSCTGITASGTATWIVQQATNLFNPTITFVRANQTNITIAGSLTGATAGAGATLIDGNNASFIQFNGMEL